MADARWSAETENGLTQMLAEEFVVSTTGSRDPNRLAARAVLDWMAHRGLLVEAHSELRVEWVAESVQPSGGVRRRPFVTDADDLTAFLADYLDWFRRTDSYATGHRVLQRTVRTGPWTEPQP